ncbi:MAG: hypothetical protein IKT14_00790 [Clostridiales bacterium]|nr:hypothetical protein [Clostridiales bacterium]MBR6483529.1 hypothetical protein [Clostridiales bacterium]
MNRKNYDDLLKMERPQHINDDFSVKHPKMPLSSRAKIFAPFAALKGYEKSIDEAGKKNGDLYD